MKNIGSKYLFSLMVVALTAACGGGGGGDDTKTTGTAGSGTAGSGTAGMTAGTSPTGTAGTNPTGTAGTTAGLDTSTAGTNPMGTAGTGTAGGGCTGDETECNACRDTAEGVYAMKVELDVYWQDEENDPAAPLADPGRGKLNIYFRGEITDIDDTTMMGKGVMHPCGTELPPIFASANCTAIQIEFNPDMWDKDSIPEFETDGMTTGFGPGDILSVSKTVGELGLKLDPGSPFPAWEDTKTFACADGTGADCFPDADEDGNPGVTVTFKKDETNHPSPPYDCITGGYKYYGAPLSIGGSLVASEYADQAFIGLQTELGGSGKIAADCMSGAGVATAGDGLPSRVLACRKKTGAVCTTTVDGEQEFLDKNTPNFHILKAGEAPPAAWKFASALDSARDMKLDRSMSKGPRSSVVRLGDTGSTHLCAAIRGAAFPAFE